ncbi:hypothetical protein N9L75_08420 [Porticoccaceae bacterium]|nr:hypothetical protein [Porticoccaceae bacterium]
MRVLKDKEIDRLLGWQQEFNALNSVVRVSSESEFSLAMAQLRYLLDDRVGGCYFLALWRIVVRKQPILRPNFHRRGPQWRYVH